MAKIGTFNDKGFKGKGSVYLEEMINDVGQGIFPIGNAIKQSWKFTGETEERVSHQKETYDQALDSDSKSNPIGVEIEFDTFHHANLAIVMGGTQEKVTVTGATIVAEPKVAKLGKAVQTTQGGISAVAVKNTGGVITYTVDVDYKVTTAKMGLIEIIDGGAITADQAIEITYTHATRTYYNIKAQQSVSNIYRVLTDGVNKVDLKDMYSEIGRLSVSLDSELDIISSDDGYQTGKIVGTMVTPEGWDSPVKFHFGSVDS